MFWGVCVCVCVWYQWSVTSVCQCVILSVVSDSLWPHGLLPARLPCPWDFPGKNTEVGCHSFLQGIFLTQGLNLALPHCRQILYLVSHRGSPTRRTQERQRLGLSPKNQNKCIAFGLIATCEKVFQDLGNCNPRMSQQYSRVVKEANVILGALIEV